MNENPTVATRPEAAARLAADSVKKIIVCAGTGCVANGSLKVYEALAGSLSRRGRTALLEFRPESEAPDSLRLSRSGCQGFCARGPLVTLEPAGVLYTRVRVEDVEELLDATFDRGEILDRLLYVDPVTGQRCGGASEIPFYRLQTRTVLRDCGRLDPESLEEYRAGGGYAAAERCRLTMTPREVCDEILASGLRGRGGGGFPTGKKWLAALAQPNGTKYVICNGDEGDPGAFMDRSVMEGNPHSVLEGILIAAYATGASEAYVYVRLEYPLAVTRIRRAVADAEAAGILGEHVLKIHVMEGAGAFVCGEETALISSIEGRRGMPSPKPPYPAVEGLWGKPTVINNVETLATVPLILARGAATFRALGTEGSPGTKTFALSGHVANTGLIEVPLGVRLRRIIYDIGGGVTDTRGAIQPDGFKAVQIGGPSGGCLTEEMLDLPMDFDTVKKAGAMIGSGGLVVLNRDTCMVAMARYFMVFTQSESCGKCVLCREGTKQMLALLDQIVAGTATPKTLETLERLAWAVQQGSLCGLGKTAPNPVLTTLRFFRNEYEAHIHQKRCPAGACKALTTYTIEPSKCRGCTACIKVCPAGAIRGERKKPHEIDTASCIRCGACRDACRFEAVMGGAA